MTARLLVMVLGLLVASPALADNWKDCASTNSDLGIKGCSAIIKAGRETKKNLAIAYNNRGLAYADKGNSDRAIDDYDKAISLNPKYADAYNNRGLVYADKGNPDRAIADYDKAIKLDPNYGYAYYGRGNAYAGKGQHGKALKDFRQALVNIPSSDSWNSEARKRIAEIEQKLALADARRQQEVQKEIVQGYPIPKPHPKPIEILMMAAADIAIEPATDDSREWPLVDQAGKGDLISVTDSAIPDPNGLDISAQNASEISEVCKFMIEILKTSKVYGALAVSKKDNACGLSQSQDSQEAARRAALSVCAEHGATDCIVFAENPSSSAH